MTLQYKKDELVYYLGYRKHPDVDDDGVPAPDREGLCKIVGVTPSCKTFPYTIQFDDEDYTRVVWAGELKPLVQTFKIEDFL